jgi:hypothetical protein
VAALSGLATISSVRICGGSNSSVCLFMVMRDIEIDNYQPRLQYVLQSHILPSCDNLRRD